MKKLSKLLINPEKLMKNEELMTLRGGYGGTCTTVCYSGSTCYGYLLCTGNCTQQCRYAFSDPNAYGIPSHC